MTNTDKTPNILDFFGEAVQAAALEKAGRTTQKSVFLNHITRYQPLQATDKNGKPATTKDGSPVYVQAKDENGKPLVNDKGVPVFENDKTKPIFVKEIIREMALQGCSMPLAKFEKWAKDAALASNVTQWKDQKKKNSDRVYTAREVRDALVDAVSSVPLPDGKKVRAQVLGAGVKGNEFRLHCGAYVPSKRTKKSKKETK